MYWLMHVLKNLLASQKSSILSRVHSKIAADMFWNIEKPSIIVLLKVLNTLNIMEIFN